VVTIAVIGGSGREPLEHAGEARPTAHRDEPDRLIGGDAQRR
jgi:hypothetical protein